MFDNLDLLEASPLVVAAAFHSSRGTLGVLHAILVYVIGTYGRLSDDTGNAMD